MPLSMLFWVVFLIWVLFGGYYLRENRLYLGGHGLLAVLIFLLGWGQFGFVVK